MNMIQDIDKHIDIINDSLKWAREFNKHSFPEESFKEYRRKLAKIRRALTANCSVAAYGESQVGKSYLMSSLLSSSDQPFVIENEGKEYSFIDALNPSGGNNNKIESTGVITRFTLKKDGDNKIRNFVKIQNLSVVDIILLLADSYYNDIRINPETVLPYDIINNKLEQLSVLWEHKQIQHSVINEDDIKDINDYVKEVIGNSAAAIYQSNFCKVIAPVIQYIPYDKWIDIFGLLWNQNPELNRLFATLINAYKKIDFKQNIYVPFNAVLRDTGTILKIDWLDTVCGIQSSTGTDEIYTDIYDFEGNLITNNFHKGDLSALIAELTFELPEKIADDRRFLKEMDLLDFPGARSREKYKEVEISEVLPKMLRRGKVAYLFNKYSRSLQISSVLFCHHNDQKAEPTIGETINNWIEENIGKNTEERAKMLQETNGIAPLFFVATKFNIDLERTKNDKVDNLDTLDKHWDRFDTVFPEIIKPNKWLDEWIKTSDGRVEPFRNIYPLRDFYYSGKNGLFDGYRDSGEKSPETSIHYHNDFPAYLDKLRDSFIRNKFVKKHFSNPEVTWQNVATLNNDGSKAIIRNLDTISGFLDNARRSRYQEQLNDLKRELISALEVYYEPEDVESKNKKVRLIAGDIRRSLSKTVATDPSSFGKMLDELMVNPEEMRNIAYDIIVCHSDTPKDFSAINFLRATCEIDLDDSREANIQKLLLHYLLESEEELEKYIKSQGFELDDVFSRDTHTLSSIADVLVKHITDYWSQHLNSKAQTLKTTLPHSDEVVHMLINLFAKLDVRRIMTDKIKTYTEIFSENEQPNAIGDYASLTLNNFVSTVGRGYIPSTEINELKTKSQNCELPVNLSDTDWSVKRHRQPLLETLKVFDEASSIVNQGKIDIDALRKLPFWNNYQRWENLVFIGLIYSSDISPCDPLCNEKVKSIIERSQTLYTE